MGIRTQLPLKRTPHPSPPRLPPLVQPTQTAQRAQRPTANQPRLTPLWSRQPGLAGEMVRRGLRPLLRRTPFRRRVLPCRPGPFTVDQARTAPAGQVRENPACQHEQPVLEADQIDNVDPEPERPREEPAQLDAANDADGA